MVQINDTTSYFPITNIQKKPVKKVNLKLNHRKKLINNFEHLYKYSDVRCAYWDTEENVMSDLGCTVVKVTVNHTECECSHLTNYAVLIDMHGIKLPVSKSQRGFIG